MSCSRSASVRLGARLVCVLPLLSASHLLAQPPAPTRTTPGQFFTLTEPLTDQKLRELRTSVSTYLTRLATREPGTPDAAQSAEDRRPVLVFEFRPADDHGEPSSFGAASDLADYLERGLSGARKTVAYVPEPLSGFAVLAVLACDEIVLGPDASLGPIMPKGQSAGEREQAVVRQLARTKGRQIDLLLGLLDPTLDLREVRTADATHFVLAENLEAFRKSHTVVSEQPAWDAQRGVLTAEHARRTIVQLLASDRAEITTVYNLPSAAADPTLGAPASALVIPVRGPITTLIESYLLRQIARAQTEGVNLIFFEINSEGGLFEEANKIATAIAELEGIRTVAYIDDRALGVAAFLPLACDEIVLRVGSRMGDIRQQVVDTRGRAEELDERQTEVLADRIEDLARQKGRSPAAARALVDPSAIVHVARDKQSGSVQLVLDRQVQAEPGRYEILETPKSVQDSALMVTDKTAATFRLADRIVADFDELASAHGVRPEALRQAQRTWVDSLVDTLNSTWVKGLLLFLGFFLLMLEIKLPGIGLPAILAALCFLLYFWSNYLGGTADQLEILLFIGGLLCLGLELFVFPGFGVFGMSGVFLILISVVMASHTFTLPTRDYEYRELAATLLQIVGILAGVIVGAVVLSRYLPSIPIFNRLVLKPQPPGAFDLAFDVKPPVDPDAPLSFLLGEVGRTTTVLRPSGRARFGEMLVDVTADGFYIEADQPVEVVEVRGSRVLVKRA